MKGFIRELAGPFQTYTDCFFIAFFQPYGRREFTLQQLDLTVGNLQLVEFRRPSSVVPNAHALVAAFDKTFDVCKCPLTDNTLVQFIRAWWPPDALFARACLTFGL